MHAPTGTECNIVLETPSAEYETDEEEFTRPGSMEPLSTKSLLRPKHHLQGPQNAKILQSGECSRRQAQATT